MGYSASVRVPRCAAPGLSPGTRRTFLSLVPSSSQRHPQHTPNGLVVASQPVRLTAGRPPRHRHGACVVAVPHPRLRSRTCSRRLPAPQLTLRAALGAGDSPVRIGPPRPTFLHQRSDLPGGPERASCARGRAKTVMGRWGILGRQGGEDGPQGLRSRRNHGRAGWCA